MTREKIAEFLKRFELGAPVEISDLVHIRDQLRGEVAAGMRLEVVDRGAIVEVLVVGPAVADRFELPVSGYEAPAKRGLAGQLNAIASR